MKSYRHILLSVAFVSLVPVTHGQVTLNPSATRALGAARLEQLGTLTNIQPNLVEGREFNSPEAIALDLSANPPHLYVADTANNRVLGWKNATTFNPTAGGALVNGAYADIVIGQNDLFTTIQQGPGRSGSTLAASGMTAPMGMVVDSKGNLYVIDAGNNRILRFPQPFAQTGGFFPDMVLGQPNFSTGTANYQGLGANTLNFSASGTVLQAYLKFDNFGNLWVADTGNQRVLMYPSSVLTAGNNAPSATVVLGQPDFTTNSIPTTYDPTSLTVLNYPTGIAFDQNDRLFVSESQPTGTTGAVRSRILVFNPPYSTFQSASRIIGTVVITTGQAPPPNINAEELAPGAGDVFLINTMIAAADTQDNRILVYPPFTQFTSNTLTQNAQIAIGQNDTNSGMANQGSASPNSNTLQLPEDAAFSGAPANELYTADAGNNRVIVMPMTPNSSTLGFNAATRLLGQQTFAEQAPNYIAGREFFFANSQVSDAGIAVDNTANPPHLYVADTYNNRILCFVDYRGVQTGGTASFVIGQPDLFHNVVNYNPNSNTSSANTPTNMGLNHPTGVVVDPSTGNLYVADTGNGRVMRFPSPFTQTSTVAQPADLVLGQSNFTSTINDVSSSHMFEPYGLAWVANTGLLVSDVVDSRVMLFNLPFTSGMAASMVWGQPNFTTASTGGTGVDNRFASPHGVAVDSSNRLYVADTGNNRVLVFDNIKNATNDPHSILSIGGPGTLSLTSPRSVFIDQYPAIPPATPGTTQTDEIWIGDSSRALRFYGGYSDLFSSGFVPDLILPEAGALAITTDAYASLYVADAANRVVVHYINISPLNAASYNTVRTTISPNTILALFSDGGQFGAGQQAASTIPLPTTMQAIQVLLNGTPVPLYYVSPGQINALIPNNAPTNGTADLQVLRTDNGQTLGDTTISMTNYAPGLFTFSGTGKGQAAAYNSDGTQNSSSNPAARGTVLTVYGTGIGNIPGAPNDGSAVSGPTPAAGTGTAAINGIPCTVQYLGLAPGEVGVFQANILISQSVPPTSTLQNRTSELVVFLNGIASDGSGEFGIQVTVWVK